ncbi:MAG: GntR family transcriptional regulator [Candidatus Dormibacteraceae bacterium]
MTQEQPSQAFPYHRIVEDLRSAILEGSISPGAQLPSENELAARYATSRPTVRRAVALLKAEGLVVTAQGRGSFVRPRPHVRIVVTGANFRRHRREGRSGFNAQVEERGQRAAQRIVEVSTTPAPEEIATRLQIEPGALAVVRRRVFLADDQPVSLCDSYYDAQVAVGTALALPGRIRGGAYAVIEDPDGPIRRTIARSIDEVTSRMPSPHESELLSIPPGVPVMRVIRTVLDSTEKPLEVQVSVAAADRHELRYEVLMS